MLEPLFRVYTPAPLAASPKFAVFGAITSPAVSPVALIFALMLTLFDAISVSEVLVVHVTGSLTFTLPEPAAAPKLLSISMLLFPNKADSSLPVMSPPLAATVNPGDRPSMTRSTPWQPRL